MTHDSIVVRGARMHNLKNIDVTIPKNKLVVVTGLSGSGKSSLAFDTVYAEGQRRYIESLSAYARQFLTQMDKPDIDSIEGLSPAISIEQRTASKNPRSTVGTSTEIYDYLRVLFARVGKPFCPSCGRPIQGQSATQIVDFIMGLPGGKRAAIMAPIASGKKGEFAKELKQLAKEGFVRVRIDGKDVELSEAAKLDKNKRHDIDLFVDRVEVKAGARTRIADSVETALKFGGGIAKIVVDGEETLLSEKHACAYCNISMPDITPQLFSFNSPKGACPDCDGLGSRRYFDENLIVPNPQLSLREDTVVPWQRMKPTDRIDLIRALAKHFGFDMNTPFCELPEATRQVILRGSGKEVISFSFDTGGDRRKVFKAPFEGVIQNLERRLRETTSMSMHEYIEQFLNVQHCPTCNGKRLSKEGLSIKIAGKNIADVTAMSIAKAREFFEGLRLGAKDAEVARRIIKEIRERLDFLIGVGLDYLTLDRSSATLAGGEDQRIRLATQIGSALTGVLYVLDEPSIGLHQRDNARLIGTLMRLRDLGNTVLVVEHDRDTMLSADHIIDLGPGAGVNGGHIVATGSPEEIIKNTSSLTGKYLSGEISISRPSGRRRPGDKWLTIEGASEHNLKDIDVSFPLGLFTAVTGLSGSGKSTLINDTLLAGLMQRIYRSKTPSGRVRSIKGFEQISKVINIDQAPIGRTPRSNPATYTGVFGHIRDLYSELPEAKARGYRPGRFSFNVKGGRCETCEGDGIIRIEMHFLPDVYVECEACAGLRFNRETLEIKYKGMSIADVLGMTVHQAHSFFANIPAIRHKLETLIDVGLGYIELGQPATTLSGGEAQRVKLSKELARRSFMHPIEGAHGKTLYILDEPTTGLHFDDVQKLLDVLGKLVDAGNTVIVIEHNLDVIKFADYCIDMGPEGGDRGGRIIATGPPEEVAANENSYTGQYLKAVL
jgi:excinuclease ABC subunit A